MQFGRVPDIDRVSFDPPPPDERTRAVLDGGRGQGRLYVGAPVWSVPEWVGEVYPEGAVRKDYLAHYSRRFSAVELNATFYGTPPAARLEGWREVVPEDFRFCAKIPRDISHGGGDPGAIDLFVERLRGLGPTVGRPLLQLPPELGPSRWPLVERTVRRFPPELRPAVEFRHPEWFDERGLGGVFDALRAHGVSAAIADVAGRRDVLHASLPTRSVLVRFAANELHPTDFERIDAWVERLAQWFEEGLEEAYFFVHQPGDRAAAPVIDRLVEGMARRWPAAVPERDLEPVPPPAGQIPLF